MSALFQNKFKINYPRASWHDYNVGAYLVTICTALPKQQTPPKEIRNNRVTVVHPCYFGGSDHHGIYLNDLGRYVSINLQEVSTHYADCVIPLYVVMPNHVHAVVFIEEGNDTNGEAICVGDENAKQVDEKMRKISLKRGRLSVVISGIKRAVTSYANQNNIPFAWQSGFYDRIIRDQREMNQIAEYIELNPARWELDKWYVNMNKKGK